MSRITAAVVAILVVFNAARAQEPKKDDDLAEKNLQVFRKVVERAEEEYRLFFKKPDKPHEFWAAMKFEIEVGKYDLAALHMKLLLERQPPEETDKALVQLQETEGLYAFLKLQSIKKWSDHPPFHQEAVENVQLLLKRMTTAVETHLGDPVRIAKYIVRLDAKHPEERSFALVQLNRSRERAVPYMVEALRTNLGKPLHARIVDAIVAMDREVVPPLLEVLKAADAKEAGDLDLRLTILDIMRRRNDNRCVPYLWHLGSAKQYPPLVKTTAQETLAHFLKTSVAQLPPAKMMLLELAEKYYQHKVRFESRTVRIWPWDGQKLALKPLEKTTREAEEFFGLRHAREAIDLDPSYRPAQIAFLSLLLERTFEKDLDKFFFQPLPEAIQNLLATLDADLVMDVLERALVDKKSAVALPCIQVLGQRGETRAARLGNDNNPRALVKALFHPDRRVQFAAAQALARMPASTANVAGLKPIENNPPPPVAAERVVEILQRFLASDSVPKALAGFVPPEQINDVKNALKECGFEPVIGRNLAETLSQLKKTADVDAILLHAALPAKDRAYVLGQLRGGVDQRLLPIVLLTPQRVPEVIRFLGNWTFQTGDILHTWTIQHQAGRWQIHGNLAIGGTLLGVFHADNVGFANSQLQGTLVFDKKPNFDRIFEVNKGIPDAFWEPGTTARLVPQDTSLELEWKNGGAAGRQLVRTSLDEHTGKGIRDFPWLKDWVGAWNDPGPNPDLRKTWFVRINAGQPLIYGYYFKGDKIEGFFHADKVRLASDKLEFITDVDKKPAADPGLALWDGKEASLVPQGDVFQLNRVNDPFGRYVKLNRILADPVLAEEGFNLAGESAERLARRHAHVVAAPESLLLIPEHLKKMLDEALQASHLKPISVEERKHFAKAALDYLWKMARGEIRGYDVRPARDAVVFALKNEELALTALEVIGRLPGADTQQRLAALVLDPRYQKVHVASAIELNRHVQKNGLQLQQPQMLELRKTYAAAQNQPELRAQLALLLGSSRPSATQSGQKLIQFQPPPPVEKK